MILSQDSHTFIPLWVKIYNVSMKRWSIHVPMKRWSIKGKLVITSGSGKPLHVDLMTGKELSWGMLGFVWRCMCLLLFPDILNCIKDWMNPQVIRSFSFASGISLGTFQCVPIVECLLIIFQDVLRIHAQFRLRRVKTKWISLFLRLISGKCWFVQRKVVKEHSSNNRTKLSHESLIAIANKASKAISIK